MTALALALADLRADCSRCAALCCVVPAFARSADFALDKPGLTPCPNLQADDRCGIHAELRPRGFPGCEVFDCSGAGQHVVQQVFAGRTWREDPGLLADQAEALTVLRGVFEVLRLLLEAEHRLPPGPLRDEVGVLRGFCERVRAGSADTDPSALRAEAGPLLERASAQLRRGLPGRRHRGADLVGRDLRREDLRGADLRGALLLGADLRGADLDRADLLGADLRGADLRGARLETALLVLPQQLRAARGDATTTVPEHAGRPAHWP